MSYELSTESQFVLNAISNYSVPTITEDINFWMIRTKKGFFYREFIENGYIALAWNIIDSSTSLKDTKELSDYITQMYPEIKRPTTVINKCKHFIEEVKEGDIILIPSQGTSTVTFARAGKYYEEFNMTYELERDTIFEIENGNSHINSVPCPYKKRRKIEIITTINSSNLNYHLYRALTNYHGISNLKDYSSLILNHIYPCYRYDNNLYFTFTVRSKDDLSAVSIYSLMKSTIDLIVEGMGVPEEKIKTKINLNSPGDISMILVDIFNHLSIHWKEYAALIVLFTGGNLVIGNVSIETPSVLKGLKELLTLKDYLQIYKDKHIANQDAHQLSILEQKTKELENKGKELENKARRIELKEKELELKDKETDIQSKELDNELKRIEIAQKKITLTSTQSAITETITHHAREIESIISACESLDIGPNPDAFSDALEQTEVEQANDEEAQE